MRFGVVGGGISAFNFVLYMIMVAAGFHYLIPTTIGWGVGVALSYIGNKYWAFMKRGSPDIPELYAFLVGYLLQLALGSTTLFAAIDLLGVSPNPAYVANLAITAVFSYCFLDRLVFNARRQDRTTA